MSDDDDFGVEDESIEDLKAAWKRGEKGVTSGPRDLNQRAMSIVGRAVERFESEPEPVTIATPLTIEGPLVIDTTGWFAPEDSPRPAEGGATDVPTQLVQTR